MIKTDGSYPFDYPNGWFRFVDLSIELAARMVGVKHFGPNCNYFPNKEFVVVGLDPSAQKTLAVYHHDHKFELIINERPAVFEMFLMRFEQVEKYPDKWAEVLDSTGPCERCKVVWRRGQPCPECGTTIPDFC